MDLNQTITVKIVETNLSKPKIYIIPENKEVILKADYDDLLKQAITFAKAIVILLTKEPDNYYQELSVRVASHFIKENDKQ